MYLEMCPEKIYNKCIKTKSKRGWLTVHWWNVDFKILQKYPTNLVSIRTRPFLQFIWTFGCITLIFGTSRVVQSWVWVWLEPRTRWSHCVMELRLPTFCVCCHSCCLVFDSVQWLCTNQCMSSGFMCHKPCLIMLVVFSFAGACSFLSPYLLYMFVSMTCLIIAVFLFDTSYLYFFFDYPLFPLPAPTLFSYVLMYLFL